MRNKLGKFIFAATVHVILLLAVNLVCIDPVVDRYAFKLDSLFFLMTHVFISVAYFSIIWSSLYAYDSFYFISFGRRIVLKSLLYSVLIVAVAIAGIHGLSQLRIAGKPVISLVPFERYLAVALVIIIIDLISFLLLYFLQTAWIKHLIGLGYLKKNVMVIGDPDERFPLTWFDGETTRIYQGRLVRRGSSWFYIDKNHGERSVPANKIQDLLFEKKAGEVIFFLCKSISRKDVENIISALNENSINYYLIPDVEKLSRSSFNENSFPYIPIIRKFVARRDSVTRITIKRLLDLVLVSASMVIVAPLVLIISLWIKLEDNGPVYYAHERVGKDGRIIKFLKFRTMVVGAEAMKKDLLPYNSRGDGPLFKMKNDPRVTRVGTILRTWSLDELPQFFNVLKGDLSLVGPRPHLVCEVSEYGSRDMLRLECIPGITCLPQVYGRDDLTFKKWIEMDLSYRKHWSVALDFRILVASFAAVISPLFKSRR